MPYDASWNTGSLSASCLPPLTGSGHTLGKRRATFPFTPKRALRSLPRLVFRPIIASEPDLVSPLSHCERPAITHAIRIACRPEYQSGHAKGVRGVLEVYTLAGSTVCSKDSRIFGTSSSLVSC